MLNRLIILIFLLGGMVAGAEEGKKTSSGFEVHYKVVSGAELGNLLKLPKASSSDYCYVVGFVSSGKKNSLLEISFVHKKDRTFNTTGFRRIGWVDGNRSAEKFFLIPIGLRDTPLPENPNDLNYEIKETLSK